MVRRLGVLFMMWNVAYAVALCHPVHHRISLYEAQTISLVEDSVNYLSLPTFYEVLRGVFSKQS